MIEEWKPIIGYENRYEISNFGNIKSIPYSYKNQFGATISKKECILKPIIDKRDNLNMVSLYINKKAKRYSIARLVGLHFLDKPEDDSFVIHHIDRKDTLNDCVTNLKWQKRHAHFKVKTDILNKIEKNNIELSIDLENVSGVYKILNIITNKFYIGSSKNICDRLFGHFQELRKNTHYNKYLQNAYNKYGEGNFVLSIVEICNNTLEREQYYIDTLKPEYNLAKIAAGGISEHTYESKLKISASLKIYYENVDKEILNAKNRHLSLIRKGTKLSEEHKQKIKEGVNSSIAHKLFLNKLHNNKEIHKKISDSKSKAILQFDKNMNFLKEWKSEKYIFEELNISGAGNVCRGKRKTSGGFIWKYKN